MSIERVRNCLSKFGAEDRIKVVETSSETVEAAAAVLHTEPARIAKSLSFYAGESALIVVMAGDKKADNKKFRETFGYKPRMLRPADVEPLTGHKIGGVSPFGVKDGIEVYLDVSLKRFASVWPAAGSGNSMIEVSLAELQTYSRAKAWVDVGK